MLAVLQCLNRTFQCDAKMSTVIAASFHSKTKFGPCWNNRASNSLLVSFKDTDGQCAVSAL